MLQVSSCAAWCPYKLSVSMYPWSCCHFSILLTAFSSSIRCLVKLCTFAEFTSLITIWDNITEDCVLSLNSFLKRQENPLWCCWGSLFIIQLLSLSTALPLNSTRKTVNCLGFFLSWFLLKGEHTWHPFGKNIFLYCFPSSYSLFPIYSFKLYSSQREREKCDIWAWPIPFLPLWT